MICKFKASLVLLRFDSLKQIEKKSEEELVWMFAWLNTLSEYAPDFQSESERMMFSPFNEHSVFYRHNVKTFHEFEAAFDPLLFDVETAQALWKSAISKLGLKLV